MSASSDPSALRLDRAGALFRHSVTIIKLRPEAREDEHLALLGTLNSSVVCFWLKQVCQEKPGFTEPWTARFEFNSSNLGEIPLTPQIDSESVRAIDGFAMRRAALLENLRTDASLPLASHLAGLQDTDIELTLRMISLQEELDWAALAAYGLASEDLPVFCETAPPIDLGERAFEIVLARKIAVGEVETTWFERHGSTPVTMVPAHWPAEYRGVVEKRIALIESDPDIGLVERPEHKRRWSRDSWEVRQRDALQNLVLDTLEERELWSDLRVRSTAELTDILRRDPLLVEALELLSEKKDADLAATVRRLVVDVAVPQPSAQRLSDKGLRKRAVWERVWDLQRAEDRIDARTELPDGDPQRLTPPQAQALKDEEVGVIPIPPRYTSADFRPGPSWKHRGKLDVPKERFVLIPNAERGADTSPVVGWAGWDERDLARALAGRIMELREQDAADAERLTPLLAGVLELLPWIYQWHPESDPLYGGPPGQYFENWLDGQLTELAVTRDTLRSWRPPALTRGRRAKASTT